MFEAPLDSSPGSASDASLRRLPGTLLHTCRTVARSRDQDRSQGRLLLKSFPLGLAQLVSDSQMPRVTLTVDSESFPSCIDLV